MPGGLDHIVHAVRDLDAAADAYRQLGFIVGTRNRHPWGTHNRIIQLDGFFIEILTVAEPEKIEPHRDGGYSFGAFQRDYLTRREGLSMLLLASDDAAQDARGYATAGIGDEGVFTFAREGVRSDGSVAQLGFALAFARDALSPDAGFAVCQHLHPENFWSPAFQAHANTAQAAAGVVMVADNPTDHHIFLGAYTGLRDLHATSSGVTARTPRGDITIMEPVSFRDQYGVHLSVDAAGARFAGLRIAVRDVTVVERLLQQNAVEATRHLGRLIVPDLFGATLIFEQGMVR
ncbi:VOC family protein [Rhodopseudomonas sp. HC1]|uniref:VOC family protein n=1 Tax=Rhodopseudomonas infernalis TaxID=2897386 RepID=UPI001EE8559F|nr:VOC family protein [Rhodopseudomonas infernalis]MCG6205951.1 VOC family protein [Rhodopseudomonas infernalis]